jgi:hypothetical protein
MRYFIVYIQEERDWGVARPRKPGENGELVLAMVVKREGLWSDAWHR